MNAIKIISNPYEKIIKYQRKTLTCWYDISEEDNNSSALVSKRLTTGVFPFIVKDIVTTIVQEYYDEKNKIEIVFEGTSDEYAELKAVCSDDDFCEQVICTQSSIYLENARDVFKQIGEIFSKELGPLIKSVAGDSEEVNYSIEKFSDVSKPTIPLCILGNYSSGKSTFINSLIGYEVLPSGDEPLTAKVYEIKQSSFSDRAKVEFTCGEKPISINFEEGTYRINSDSFNNELIDALSEDLNENISKEIPYCVSSVIYILNGYENVENPISDLIEIEVPFSSKGVLGSSKSQFVIFDTPGSNSASNDKHFQVLKAAMKNLSNGLPIYVAEYDTLDSKDNESLYNEIEGIDELDCRYTMIVVNKADNARLPKNGFSETEENNTLRLAIPRHLYSEGIYFVSSVMGLGSKTDGQFVDEFLAEIYDDQKRKYSDKKHPSYKRLYQYDILAGNLKKQLLDESSNCDNLVFSNSGLFAVEKELLSFATKYSPYNKCHQARMYLRKAIDDTNEVILRKRATKETTVENLRNNLNANSKNLIDKMRNSKKSTEDNLLSEYYTSLKTSSQKVIEDMQVPKDVFLGKERDWYSLLADEYLLSDKDKEVKTAFKDAFSKESLISGDAANQFKNLAKVFNERTEKARTIDAQTSEELVKYTVNMFNRNIVEAHTMLEEYSKDYLANETEKVKKDFISIVKGDKELSDVEKNELENIILSFSDVTYERSGDTVFFKKDFERGIRLGNLQIGPTDKIRVEKLCRKYNYEMKKTVGFLTNRVRNNHRQTVINWIDNLLNTLTEKIVEYNPDLKILNSAILETTREINHLVKAENEMKSHFENINSMLDWKDV